MNVTRIELTPEQIAALTVGEDGARRFNATCDAELARHRARLRFAAYARRSERMTRANLALAPWRRRWMAVTVREVWHWLVNLFK